jgi:hypothetical protein
LPRLACCTIIMGIQLAGSLLQAHTQTCTQCGHHTRCVQGNAGDQENTVPSMTASCTAPQQAITGLGSAMPLMPQHLAQLASSRLEK